MAKVLEFQLHASHSILEVVLPTEETQAGMVERECWGTSAEGRSQEVFLAAKVAPGQLVGSTCLQTPPGGRWAGEALEQEPVWSSWCTVSSTASVVGRG